MIGIGISGEKNTLHFEITDAVIGLREARRDTRVRATFNEQRSKLDTLSKDMARRDTANRPFIGWDGEGYSTPDGVHHYMLFGASTGHEVSGTSLGTAQCLDLMLEVEEANPNTFHVIFAGNYDVNMMLRDVPEGFLRQLKERGWCRWNGYTIRYIKGKMFGVKRGKISLTLYDVFTFFGCSFVKALDQYIGDDNETMARIRHGKSQRANFGYSDLADVRTYFRAELQYLVRLCDALRTYLRVAGIEIAKWHGPGAVASSVLKSRGFSRLSQNEAVDTASQYAYLGGRFEQFRVGLHEGPVWQYDIRSAYPAAIATLPSLRGEWKPRDIGGTIAVEEVRDYSLYYVEWVADKGAENLPQPFGWRYRNGAVFYPPVMGGNWVWGAELKNAIRYGVGRVSVTQALEYTEQDAGHKPFAWIAEMYDRRDEWKRNGNPAQLALKLAMNSIYGKLAQQVGWRVTDGKTVLPAFHQLEHAGYITAYARGKLYAALMQQPESVIACETDAVYSRRALDLDVGRGLGEWEETKYDGIMYVQSGMYFANEAGDWKYRTRGFSRNDVSVDTVRTWLNRIWCTSDAMGDKLGINQTRFKTMGTSLGKSDWRKWVTGERELAAGVPGGKREHSDVRCSACRGGRGSYGQTLHDMVTAFSIPGVDYNQPSTKYPLEWLGDKRSEWKGDNDDVWQDD